MKERELTVFYVCMKHIALCNCLCYFSPSSPSSFFRFSVVTVVATSTYKVISSLDHVVL